MPLRCQKPAEDFDPLSEVLNRGLDTGDDRRKAQEWADDAEKSAGEAAASAQAAAGSAEAARESLQAIGDSVEQAAGSAGAAAKSAGEAATSEQNAADSEKAANDWASLSKSWAIGEGAPEQHPEEKTDNAKYYAEQAKGSAGSAAQDAARAGELAQTVVDNEQILQAVAQNIPAILAAVENALAAQAAAESAEGDADRAEEAADRAQQIGQGALGYYAKETDLQAAHETGENGQWAIIGETDTIWVWDSDSGAWSNSGNKTDLSKYYTKDEADAELNELQKAMNEALTRALAEQKEQTDTELAELQTALGQQITAATSRTWSVTVPVTAWTDGAETWAGIEAKFKAEITCEGMTPDTVLAPPQYAGGDLASAQMFACADSSDGAVVLWSEAKPAAEFALTLTEVK